MNSEDLKDKIMDILETADDRKIRFIYEIVIRI